MLMTQLIFFAKSLSARAIFQDIDNPCDNSWKDAILGIVIRICNVSVTIAASKLWVYHDDIVLRCDVVDTCFVGSQ